MEDEKADEKATGLKRIFKAGGHSLRGLQYAWKSEAAIRQETILGSILFVVSFFLNISTVEHALLISTIFLVMIVEIVNSAIEAVVDRVGLEYHPLSGSAKDMGSAAVAIALILLIIVWGLILI